MLAAVVRIALALEILLVCGEGVVPPSHGYLPLGGSHLAQLGLVLGLAITIVDIWETLAAAKVSTQLRRSVTHGIGRRTDRRGSESEVRRRPDC